MAREALGMLWAVLADFRAWGRAHTLTTLDRRLEGWCPELLQAQLPAGEVLTISPQDHPAAFADMLARCDAALLIAPETGGLLARLSRQAQQAGVLLLGSHPEAIAVAGDKWACDWRLRRAGLLLPDTLKTGLGQIREEAQVLGYPLVVKPLDGVGCEGVYKVSRRADWGTILPRLRLERGREEILLQTYLEGVHASVSLLVAAHGSLPLSLNGQDVGTGMAFDYRGGVTPLNHPAAQQAFDSAQAAVRQLPGLRGYVGVDMVLAQEQAWIIEVNPRITTAYIGLRRAIQLNLAQAIWEACANNVLPAVVHLSGRATFKKDDPSTWFAAPFVTSVVKESD